MLYVPGTLQILQTHNWPNIHYM